MSRFKEFKIETNVPLDYHETFQFLCKAANKWGVSINYDPDWYIEGLQDGTFTQDEIERATNGRISSKVHIQCYGDGGAVFLFDTEEEMNNCYYDMVGDDGPTKRNSYDGKFRVYALTCSNTGQLMNENT